MREINRLQPRKEASFLEKRSKKLLLPGTHRPGPVHSKRQKFFASFFQKRCFSPAFLTCRFFGFPTEQSIEYE